LPPFAFDARISPLDTLVVILKNDTLVVVFRDADRCTVFQQSTGAAMGTNSAGRSACSSGAKAHRNRLAYNALSLFIVVMLAGCTWTGFGFKASGQEMPRLKEALVLRAGMVVADVGAGKGQLTLALASAVGPEGRVFSTEIDPQRLLALRKMVAEAQLGNITVVEAGASESGLPDNCCDAIVLRRVYHHLSDPGATNASLFRALRPNGLLAVIDFPPPPLFSRGSPGVPAQDVVDEVTANGFRLLRVSSDWPGRGPLGSYCALFRKPPPHG
jgi:SAM-dependent methyltransferase